MATVFYGMSGEGRGHATRARTVVEALRGKHRLVLFAADHAHALLAPEYEGTDVRVVRIPGLRFAYDAKGGVGLFGTLALAAGFRFRIASFVRAVLPEFARERPDLVIADFEPILPRAARALGVPFVSFDHQHYLVACDLSALPFGLRRRAAVSAPFVSALYDWQVRTIVSSFYAPPLRPAYGDAVQVGVLIRPDLLRVRPERGAHVCAYVRRHAPASLLDSFAACGREIRVYGLGARPSEAGGRVRFMPIDERRFVEDLATCDAVVSTAGNQLVGEALHLRKPVLVLPEARNFEQAVNAHFLERTGAGWAETGTLLPSRLRAFLDSADALRARIAPDGVCGNSAAIAALQGCLGRSAENAPVPARLDDPSTVTTVRAQWV